MITNEEIIKSREFKLLNYQIDQKITEINWLLSDFKERVDDAYNAVKKSWPPVIDTRTYEESNGTRNPIAIVADISQLKNHKDTIENVLRLEQEIGELQRLKLKMLNDYDFTRGDDTIQKEFFGE